MRNVEQIIEEMQTYNACPSSIEREINKLEQEISTFMNLEELRVTQNEYKDTRAI